MLPRPGRDRPSPTLRWAAALAVAGIALTIPPRRAAAQRDALPARERAAAATDTLTLSLADVRRLAERQNPTFLAARQDVPAARGVLRQAGVLRFNPDAVVQAPGGGSPTQLTLTQEFEFAGQRALRVGAARTGVQRAAAGVRDAGRRTLADASVAFYRALAGERRLAVATEVMTLNERLLGAVRTQRREGEVSALEANLGEIELGRARGRVLAERRAATRALLELTRLAGVDPVRPVRLVDDAPEALASVGGAASGAAPPGVIRPTVAPGVPGAPPAAQHPDPERLDHDSLIAAAMARRPDLALTEAATREAEALASLARREALPNVRLGAYVEREPARQRNRARIGPAVGISLPLFNRNQGVVAQREAEAGRARLERRATELQVRTDVTDAMRAYRTASEEAGVFRTAVLEPARQNSALLESAYRAGKLGLPTLLLLRNQLLDAELGYWDAWLAEHEALTRLESATGALAITAPLDSSPAPARAPRGDQTP